MSTIRIHKVVSSTTHKNHVNFTDFISFLKACQLFIQKLKENVPLNCDKDDFSKLKTKCKKDFMLGDVCDYLILRQEEKKTIEGGKVFIKKETIIDDDGKPLIGIHVMRWVVKNKGLSDPSHHGKKIMYTDKKENLRITTNYHTHRGILEAKDNFADLLIANGLQDVLKGALFAEEADALIEEGELMPHIGKPNLRGSNFSGLSLKHAYMPWVLAEDSRWDQTDLSGAVMNNGMFVNATFNKAKLTHANMEQAKIYNDKNGKGSAEAADFSYAYLKGIQINIDAHHAIFNYAYLQGANLSRGSFESASFMNADCEGAMLYGSQQAPLNLKNTDFSDARLIGADMNLADLTGAKFVGAKLMNSNLEYSIFLKANLDNADLENANIKKINIGCETLSRAKNIIFIRWGNEHQEKSENKKTSYTYKELTKICLAEGNFTHPDQKMIQSIVSHAYEKYLNRLKIENSEEKNKPKKDSNDFAAIATEVNHHPPTENDGFTTVTRKGRRKY